MYMYLHPILIRHCCTEVYKLVSIESHSHTSVICSRALADSLDGVLTNERLVLIR